MLLWVGVLLLVVAVVVVVLATAPASTQSLALEELVRPGRRTTVAKNELCEDRLLDPLLNALRGLAVRLSPAGTSERIAHSLDKAGNPPSWSLSASWVSRASG